MLVGERGLAESRLQRSEGPVESYELGVVFWPIGGGERAF